MSNWVSIESRHLTETEMQNNAQKVREFGASRGWSLNAIAALCANLEAESSINPGRWEGDNVGVTSAGFGLAQWTPSTKLTNWILETFGNTDYTNGDYQMQRFVYEADNGLQYYQNELYPSYNTPALFSDWLTSNESPSRLAKVFLHNYERPGDQSTSVENYRGQLADKWYEFLTGSPPPSGSIPVWLLFKCGRFKRT